MPRIETPDRAALQKRENEIIAIMRQMKSDNLHHSPVFEKLQRELQDLKQRLLQLS